MESKHFTYIKVNRRIIEMEERKYDHQLNIRTVGVREQSYHEAAHHNRYEATPYKALDELFKIYKISENDKLIDFGCGRGRTMFYVHHRFQIPVTGIEANDKTFEEALNNKKSYRYIARHIGAPINFLFGLAEDIEIHENDNLFYFFNPFSLKIFKKVVYNILGSVSKDQRTIEMILYYPLPEFKRFLKKNTPFEIINKIKVPGIHGKYGKFLIYRYSS